MCIFGGSKSVAPPPPLPPAPPPPLPPVAPTPPPDPVVKDINPQVKEAKDERGKKEGGENVRGTGALKIKLKPKVNTGMTKAGGIN